MKCCFSFFSLGFSKVEKQQRLLTDGALRRRHSVWKQWDSPNTMRRVCVSVEPSGFWAVQRNMEPLSSAGTLSRTSSRPTNSSLPSSRRPPTLDQVNMGSGNTSLCGRTNTGETYHLGGQLLELQPGTWWNLQWKVPAGSPGQPCAPCLLPWHGWGSWTTWDLWEQLRKRSNEMLVLV